jgi:hypothetical protein
VARGTRPLVITAGDRWSHVASGEVALRRAIQVRRAAIWAGVDLGKQNPLLQLFTTAISHSLEWLYKAKLAVYRFLSVLVQDSGESTSGAT